MHSNSDNGILSRIPAQFIARALNTLPPAETATDQFMETTVDVPELGAVRITAKRFKHKKGKRSIYFWTAEKAVTIER
jgi:hypothetical protein